MSQVFKFAKIQIYFSVSFPKLQGIKVQNRFNAECYILHFSFNIYQIQAKYILQSISKPKSTSKKI